MSVCPSVCLSVCLSDMFVYCIQTTKDIVELLSRPSSPIILVFDPSADDQFQGEPLHRGGMQNTRGGKMLRFLTEIAVYLRNGAIYPMFAMER